ncbi:MAG: Uncharacterized protein Athens101410_127 [Parcubacteria group bacterium Athens1014_10]|nr:MAG: Uncharacterized protein Athens101410_127 [Parcubacteria group bacterium Athens1014_10]TSD05904.1 MAG: Uncharacterized protein Athens071412_186 [Parcubacteria group bacterium Athens0714_12]
MYFIYYLLAILIGSLLTIKSEWFLNNFGRVEWAEKHLGLDGGSRLFYKLLGIAIIIIALLFMTGLMQNWLLGFFFPFLNPKL